MQIVSGDITRDITGEIVYLKAYKQMVGEVTGYSTEKGTATVKLCDTGLEITVSLDDIESTGSTQPHRAIKSDVQILGTRNRIRSIDKDGEKTKTEYITMNGKDVFQFAVRKVPQVIQEVLKENKLSAKDIDWFVLHQANARIVDAVARRLHIGIEKFPMNLQEYGNTSSASVPILLNELNRNGLLKKRQKLVLAGFGAGLSWGADILEWDIKG